MIKTLKTIYLLAMVLVTIGFFIVFFKPYGCSPFIGVGLVFVGMVAAFVTWVYWHFIKYD